MAVTWLHLTFPGRPIYIGVWSENYRAQRFYQRRGFEWCGEYLYVVGDARDREWILREVTGSTTDPTTATTATSATILPSAAAATAAAGMSNNRQNFQMVDSDDSLNRVLDEYAAEQVERKAGEKTKMTPAEQAAAVVVTSGSGGALVAAAAAAAVAAATSSWTYPLLTINHHLFVDLPQHGRWLVDTGAPLSFGGAADQAALVVGDVTVALQNAFSTAEQLSAKIGVPCQGMCLILLRSVFCLFFFLFFSFFYSI